jgi:DNA-binding transcriptional LysR family regulator
VLRGELQAGFGVLPIVDKALWIERVAHEPFCVCIAEHHRLATHSRLAAQELSNETLVWIPRNIHRLFYDQIVDYLRTLNSISGAFRKPIQSRRPSTSRPTALASRSCRNPRLAFSDRAYFSSL